LPFAVDEDFNNKLVRALLRRKPDLDIVSVSSLGFSEADDPTILEWAAQEGRVVLTHDVNTMTRYAYERVKAGKPMPGLFVVRRSVSIGIVLEDLLLLAE
jgi:predicted nuclease of predicted toxin-antitoxin system